MTTRSLPNLPEEIMLEIFSRTPAKSVGRFKCLSKLWLANLSTAEFINLHLNHHQEENLLLITDVRSLHTIAPPIRDEAVSTELSGLPGNWKKVLGSCNGLVLLLNVEDELFVVNPITQQQVRVPNPPTGQDYPTADQMFGFGYDLSKDDYKILSIATYYERDCNGTFANVYSLKMGVWRSLPCDFRYESPFHGQIIITGAHVNGVIHWLSCLPYMMLSTFNLADEVFGVIPLPDNNRISRLFMASVLRGCPILVGDVQLNRVIEACIMKEYGVHESWTNFSISIRGVTSIKLEPLCFVGENEVMMLGGGSLLLSNLETQETKTVVVNGTHPPFGDGRVFVESLVSPSSFTLEAGPSQALPGSSG